MQGVLLALVPMFAWGSIGFVANKFGGDAKQQTLGMTLGAFVFALIVFLFRMPTISAKKKAPNVIPSVCCLASPPNLLATNPIEPQANIGTSARRTPCMFIFISLK